jgi:mRNA interferase MazF
MKKTSPKADAFWRTWTKSVRGDIHRLRAPRDTRGHEQQGARFAVIVQSDDLLLSTLLVAPTSRSAPARSFRPTITINNEETQVLVEQTSAVAPERLGDFVGRVTLDELRGINDALRLALELD